LKNRIDNLKLFEKYDLLVIILVLILSFSFVLDGGRNLKKGVVVEINGKPAYIFTKPGVYRIENDGRWLMDIEYDEKYGGRVRVVKSSCKLKICVRKGWITDPRDSIVCVPNKVIIYFKVGKNRVKFDEGVDIYTW